MDPNTRTVLQHARRGARERTERFAALMLANLPVDDAAGERLTREYGKLAGHWANLYLALEDVLCESE